VFDHVEPEDHGIDLARRGVVPAWKGSRLGRLQSNGICTHHRVRDAASPTSSTSLFIMQSALDQHDIAGATAAKAQSFG
jgi:hypothetical protein